MRDCVEEGILQSYFDGELSVEMTEKVSSHLNGCLSCKRAARELEGETLLFSQALEPEFLMPVPTDRLRARVDAAIAERRLLNPPRPSLASVDPARSNRWQSISSLFVISPQRAFAYGGVVAIVLFAITVAAIKFRRPPVQSNQPINQTVAVNNPAPPAEVKTPVSQSSPVAAAPVKTAPAPAASRRNSQFVAVKVRPNTTPKRDEDFDSTTVKLLPGERSYLKTIAVLDSSLKAGNNRPMRPALQSEYERNLAVVDRVIAATRTAAKNNPNDPEAAEFMFAAYQTKVDLLNQVAEARLPNRQQ